MCQVFARHIIYKKRKTIIYASRLKNIVKSKPNNLFIILLIFKTNIIYIQSNSIMHITKILVFKNHVLSIKKYHSSVYQKVNNFELTLFKIILIFLSYVMLN